MKVHLLTFAVLLAAVACYTAFINIGFIAFIILGVASETVFWVRTFHRELRAKGLR
jgi:hypothetical protein